MRLYNFWKQVKKKKRKNKFAITSYSFTLNFDTRHLTINLDIIGLSLLNKTIIFGSFARLVQKKKKGSLRN